MKDLVLRFFIGGAVVSAFAVIGDLFKPKSFAGLFGAAPSVALATLALTISASGVNYASVEARSMILGAVALGVYSLAVVRLLFRAGMHTAVVTLSAVVIWFAVAFGLWFGILRSST